ncbi:MAG: heme NO-binding domain-containing protein [Betaproteobacteria bacterium]|nr:heme NO-binding domain-containing protein [Betaproteobacteria bacterium]
MKGVVFTEFLDMVGAKFSPDMADDIIDDADPPSGGAYTAVGTYDHGEIVAMVVALSRRSGVPVPQLLHTFGQHLFGRFVELYPGFFTGITGALDFLERIENVIHVEVLKLYPDAELPRFEIHRDSADSMTMVYRSPRGMGDLAAGLIDGCIAHYGQPVSIDRTTTHDGGEVFSLRRTE